MEKVSGSASSTPLKSFSTVSTVGFLKSRESVCGKRDWIRRTDKSTCSELISSPRAESIPKRRPNRQVMARAQIILAGRPRMGIFPMSLSSTMEAKALGKLYGIQPDDENYFKPPKRNREDIKRSRGDRVRDRHFSKTNNDELIKFCRGTGLRRSELEELRGKDLVTRAQIEAEISRLETIQEERRTPADTKRLTMLQDTRLFQGEYFTFVRNGKGGRKRLSPIIGKNMEQIVERIRNTPPEEKVWQHVHKSADIHGYRAEYATAIYKAHARAIKEIPYDRVNQGTGRRYQSEVYVCRKDETGKKLDKAAMLVCSKALGHNRISVVADNYIRGL